MVNQFSHILIITDTEGELHTACYFFVLECFIQCFYVAVLALFTRRLSELQDYDHLVLLQFCNMVLNTSKQCKEKALRRYEKSENKSSASSKSERSSTKEQHLQSIDNRSTGHLYILTLCLDLHAALRTHNALL